ncbi:hypothetical protein AAHA92_17229 [Salvia divinorum]|uniref:CASP-like protein n=1 Tax=Salvia divinorum TaxID=28513 RepID=A0ABD1H186_SALDI
MGNEPTTTTVNGTTQPAATDLESGGVSVIVERWKKEDLLEKCSLGSRVFAFFFSFLTLLIMATNIHGDWRDFYHYEEYRYVLVVAILSTSYACLQSWRQIHKLGTNKDLFSWPNSEAVDYGGDQIAAYLLLSAASAAIPLTNRMRQGSDNVFTDASAAAISMAFFAFLCFSISSLISGYRLCNQSYI